jgi:hypothetical protein
MKCSEVSRNKNELHDEVGESLVIHYMLTKFEIIRDTLNIQMRKKFFILFKTYDETDALAKHAD